MHSSRLLKFFIRTAIVVVTFIFCFAMIEWGTRTFIVGDRLHLIPAKSFRVDGNAFNQAFLSSPESNCSWVESYRYSINFGYVYQNQGPCAARFADINGFQNGNPFPRTRDPKHFSILVIGGSVAEALALNERDKRSRLEKEFNRRFLGPNGQPISIYTGAIGGWAVPTQEMVLMTFMQGFDAVIAIDGANELTRLRNQNNVGQLDSIAISFNFDHTFVFGIEFALIKQMRSLRHTWPFRESYAWSALLSVLEFSAQEELFSNINRDGSIPRIGALHQFDIPEAEIIDRNELRYIRSTKNIHAISRANDIKSIHFIQPITGIAKPLTDEEKPFEEYSNRDLYRALEQRLLKELKGQPTFSQVDIFAQVREKIYADRVHPNIDPEGNSPGYDMMAADIVTKSAREWKLQPVKSR